MQDLGRVDGLFSPALVKDRFPQTDFQNIGKPLATDCRHRNNRVLELDNKRGLATLRLEVVQLRQSEKCV